MKIQNAREGFCEDEKLRLPQPKNLENSKLEVLDISHNNNRGLNLTSLLSEMSNLRELTANEGEMTEIGELADCPEYLEKINLAYNLILSITHQFDNCSGLSTVM